MSFQIFSTISGASDHKPAMLPKLLTNLPSNNSIATTSSSFKAMTRESFKDNFRFPSARMSWCNRSVVDDEVVEDGLIGTDEEKEKLKAFRKRLSARTSSRYSRHSRLSGLSEYEVGSVDEERLEKRENVYHRPVGRASSSHYSISAWGDDDVWPSSTEYDMDFDEAKGQPQDLQWLRRSNTSRVGSGWYKRTVGGEDIRFSPIDYAMEFRFDFDETEEQKPQGECDFRRTIKEHIEALCDINDLSPTDVDETTDQRLHRWIEYYCKDAEDQRHKYLRAYDLDDIMGDRLFRRLLMEVQTSAADVAHMKERGELQARAFWDNARNLLRISDEDEIYRDWPYDKFQEKEKEEQRMKGMRKFRLGKICIVRKSWRNMGEESSTSLRGRQVWVEANDSAIGDITAEFARRMTKKPV